MSSPLVEVGSQLLPGGELVRSVRTGEQLLWLSPSLPDAGSVWRRLNSGRLAGFSAVVIAPNRFTDRGNWWEHLWSAPDDRSILETVDIEHELGRLTWGSPLAPLAVRPVDERAYLEAVDGLTRGQRVGLFAADRPADVPVAAGWLRLRWQNEILPGSVIASAYLRSWEERFGARLLVLDVCRLVVAVERLPGSLAEALQLVHEHISFAPEGFSGMDDEVEEAEGLLTSPTWTFWWDE